jgi:hypothetical protein
MPPAITGLSRERLADLVVLPLLRDVQVDHRGGHVLVPQVALDRLQLGAGRRP